jgi:hypothetical protein
MAEYCAECFINKVAVPSDNLDYFDLELSDDEYLCEGCGYREPVVIGVRDSEDIKNNTYKAISFDE